MVTGSCRSKNKLAGYLVMVLAPGNTNIYASPLWDTYKYISRFVFDKDEILNFYPIRRGN